MIIHFQFTSKTYPRSVYTELGTGIGLKVKFHPDGEVESIVYNSKGVCYKIDEKQGKLKGHLYSNNSRDEIDRKDKLRFKYVEKITPEDKSVLALKYNINFSLFSFTKDAKLTDESKDKIKKWVIELAIKQVEDIDTGLVYKDSGYVNFLWSQDPKAHLAIAKELLKD